MADVDLHTLLERLRHDPTAPEVREVAHRLAADGRWKEALGWARRAIRKGLPKDSVLLPLARGAAEGLRPDRVLRALGQLSAAGSEQREAVLLRVDALADQGDRDAARRVAERWRVSHPDDDEVAERIAALRDDAPPIRGIDPMESLRRAEELAEAGYPGRALRMLRRLSLDHPEDPRVLDATRRAAVTVREAGERLRDIVALLPLPELPSTDAPDVEDVLDLDEDLLERIDVGRA